ncbi:MAG: hypothetical protein AMJ43_10070, partial [Coxiella sp. DG_40]
MLLNLEESKKAASAKRIFGWPLKALVSLAVLWLVFILAGRVLRPIAIAQIAELTNTKISVKSIDFNLDGSVFIKELVVRPNQKQTDSDAILKAKRVYARFGIGSLLLLKPRLKEITVNDFIFNAQHNLDTGKWNLSALKIRIPAGGSRKIPFVNLESGTLQYSKVSNGRAKVVAAVPLDVTFAPDGKDPCACIFSITTAKRPGFGEGILAGSWKPGRITASGGISSADVPVFERAWAVNFLDAELDYEPEGAYSLKLKIKDLLGTPVSDRDIFAFDKLLFLEKFSPFNTLQRFFNRYRPWGHIDIDLEVSGSLQKLAESTLHGKVYCKNVSICHRKFPYPVEIFGGQVDLTERSVSLNNLSGRHKDVKLFFNGWSKDFGPNRQYQFKITSDNMALDSDLYDALTAKQKKFWSVFSPSGLAVIDYRLTQRSQTDKEKILAVELLDAQAAYQHFPYPLKNLAGRLLFDHNSVVASDLVSQYNGSKITLNGTVTACRTDRPICDISVRAENIPLDSTLAAALPAGQRDLYNQYNMAGQGDADVKVFTPEGDVSPTSFIADVSFEKASLKLNQCPLPVSDISAKAVFTPDFVRIDNFIGRYGQALVSVTGRMWPAETQQSRYCLSLLAKGLELNDELFSLLPTPLEQIVSKVQPAGKVDITADLNKGGGDDCPDYQITVNCLGSSVGFGQLPCPLKDITGSLTVTEDSITLSDIVATASNVRVLPTDSTVKVNGRIALADGAFSDGRFRFSADCYSGRLAGKFQLRQPAEADLEYLLQLGFDNIDLKQFLSEPKQTLVRLATLSDTNPEETRRNSYTSGKMSGSLSITATVGEDLPHIGRCRLWMTDMQVGKLSLLAKLLQVLKLTEPKDFAFDRMFIDSYIMHNKLFFEEFDLSGESVAFNGSGWMDLQTQNVDLTLFARGQRIATEEPSILQSLTEGLGTAVVR